MVEIPVRAICVSLCHQGHVDRNVQMVENCRTSASLLILRLKISCVNVVHNHIHTPCMLLKILQRAVQNMQESIKEESIREEPRVLFLNFLFKFNFMADVN